MAPKAKNENLREACIQEAMAIIETSGIENLSMREVSRRLGVSHQAPYKHFESRDHILAEILKRSFEDFAAYLDAHCLADNAEANLSAMGYAYLHYALENPLQYRLMFATPLPNAADHPQMMEKAQHAFSLLRNMLMQMPLAAPTDLNALFVWSTLHGLTSILQMQFFDKLSLAHYPQDAMIDAVIRRIGHGIHTDEKR